MTELLKSRNFIRLFFNILRYFPHQYDLFKIKYTSLKLSVWDKSFYLDRLFRLTYLAFGLSTDYKLLRVQTRLWKQTIRLPIVCFIYFLTRCRDYRRIAVALLPPKLHRLLSNKTKIHSKNQQVYDVLSINTIQ